VGALLDSLDALGLVTSTNVVIQGDHGFSLGRHSRWSKYSFYEDAVRVPLIIAVPGMVPRVVDDVVESLDVMPTLLELWGVPRRHGGGGGGGGGGGCARDAIAL
jgi:iduronate 2-sulfatase